MDKFEVFIMSEAGKPIYSYNKREDTVTLMPLCSALMNYAQKTQKQTLNSIRTSDNLLISFTTRAPLIIIVVNEANSLIEPTILVEQVEAQIISILTHKTLRSVFEERSTFDLKRLIHGSEKFIDAITKLTVISPTQLDKIQSFLAVTSLPNKPHRVLIPLASLHPNTRTSIHSSINTIVTNKSKNIVFGLLFLITDPPNSDFQLMTICNHHSRHRLKIVDVHIVLALIQGSRSQLSSVESLWMPICLPRFNKDAFLHSYIAFINDSKYCLAMFSVDREDFTLCQTAKNLISEKLAAQQFQIPKLELSFSSQILFLWYQTKQHVLWWQKPGEKKTPDPVLYYITKKMYKSSLKTLWLKLADDTVCLGWHVPTFQLYAQFDRGVTANEATGMMQEITSWIKKEEDNFSLKDYR